MHIVWSKSIHNKNLRSYKVLVISRLPDKAGISSMHLGLLSYYIFKLFHNQITSIILKYIVKSRCFPKRLKDL